MNIINYSFNVKETNNFIMLQKKLEKFGKTETNGDFLTLTLNDNAGVLVFNLKIQSIQAKKVHIEEIDFNIIKEIYFMYLKITAKESDNIKSMSLINTNDVKMASNIISKMNPLTYTEINGDMFVNKKQSIPIKSKYMTINEQTPLGYFKDNRTYKLTSDIKIEDRITNLRYGEEVIEYSYEYCTYENIRSWGYPANLLTYQGSYYLWKNDFDNGPVFDISKDHKVICVSGEKSFEENTLSQLKNGSYEIINSGTTIQYEDAHGRIILESVSSYEETSKGYRLDPYECCYLAYGGYNIKFTDKQAPTYKIGDILLYDYDTEELVTSYYTDYTSGGSHTPIAVCCIPSNILPDKKARFIGNEYFSDNYGNTSDTMLQNKTFIDHIIKIESQNEYVGQSYTGFIPTDYNKGVSSNLNNKLYYSSKTGSGVPALYLNDFTLNEELFSYNTSSYSMLTDCDGKYNQDICKFTAGFSGAFYDCNKIYTKGTYTGEWYLPSFVELALLNTRIKEINSIREDIEFKPIDKNHIYISSTEFDSNNCIGIDFSIGHYDIFDKKFKQNVIPFFKY